MERLKPGESAKRAKEVRKAAEKRIKQQEKAAKGSPNAHYAQDGTTENRPLINVVRRTGLEKTLMGLGGATVAAVCAFGIYSLLESDSGERIINTAIETAGGAKVSADHAYRMRAIVEGMPAVEGAIDFKLSGNTTEANPRVGRGVTLRVPVEAVPNEKYSQTASSVQTPASEVSARGIFLGFSQAVAANPENSQRIITSCVQQIESFMDAIRDNSERFKSTNFSTRQLADSNFSSHVTQFAPYTDVPLLTGPRRDIEFIDNGVYLVCPEPSQ